MTMTLLAATRECRNGNCPTAWLTERGTVVLQGYITTALTIRVPSDIVERAAGQLQQRLPAVVPAPRPEHPALRRLADGSYEVTGTTLHLACPDGERAHEIPAGDLTMAVHDAREEAVV